MFLFKTYQSPLDWTYMFYIYQGIFQCYKNNIFSSGRSLCITRVLSNFRTQWSSRVINNVALPFQYVVSFTFRTQYGLCSVLLVSVNHLSLLWSWRFAMVTVKSTESKTPPSSSPSAHIQARLEPSSLDKTSYENINQELQSSTPYLLLSHHCFLKDWS